MKVLKRDKISISFKSAQAPVSWLTRQQWTDFNSNLIAHITEGEVASIAFSRFTQWTPLSGVIFSPICAQSALLMFSLRHEQITRFRSRRQKSLFLVNHLFLMPNAINSWFRLVLTPCFSCSGLRQAAFFGYLEKIANSNFVQFIKKTMAIQNKWLWLKQKTMKKYSPLGFAIWLGI